MKIIHWIKYNFLPILSNIASRWLLIGSVVGRTIEFWIPATFTILAGLKSSFSAVNPYDLISKLFFPAESNVSGLTRSSWLDNNDNEIELMIKPTFVCSSFHSNNLLGWLAVNQSFHFRQILCWNMLDQHRFKTFQTFLVRHFDLNFFLNNHEHEILRSYFIKRRKWTECCWFGRRS